MHGMTNKHAQYNHKPWQVSTCTHIQFSMLLCKGCMAECVLNILCHRPKKVMCTAVILGEVFSKCQYHTNNTSYYTNLPGPLPAVSYVTISNSTAMHGGLLLLLLLSILFSDFWKSLKKMWNT